jgi:transposase
MDAPFNAASSVPEWKVQDQPLRMKGASTMKVTTIGIDLAKNVIQVHGVDQRGKVILRRQLRRGQVMDFFAQREPCLIGMEACGSAHAWARRLLKLGYTVKLMAPQFVKPYVKTNKNDAADAEAICEAVTRPNMRFVPVKTEEQQAVLSLHRARQGFVRQRTAQANQIRGLLAEFGIVIPQGIRHISRHLPGILEDAENTLPGVFRQLLRQLGEHLKILDELVHAMEKQIQQWHSANEASQRVSAIAGVGVLTASAMVASVGDARNFSSGRQLAAWLGLVPRQHSTGGKSKLLGISKRGDCYLRTLLIHGARSVIAAAGRRKQPTVEQQQQRADQWLEALVSRRNRNVAAVALANKNARVIWALLAHGDRYQAFYSLVGA